jgi:hypothetical protein
MSDSMILQKIDAGTYLSYVQLMHDFERELNGDNRTYYLDYFYNRLNIEC